MRINPAHKILLTVLAIIFTIGLTFTSVELPRLADAFLQENVPALAIDSHAGESNIFRTELYIQHYHIRLIGYIALAMIVLLIVYGLLSNKTGFASAGAVALFLPAFGHFALSMFFLAGLGLFYTAWMPLLDIPFNILHLGDIVFLPYRWLLSILSLVGIQGSHELPYIIVGSGLFVFLSGTLTWMYVKFEHKQIADFWIYRFSRHPQYLGWILWSYGMILLPGNMMKKSWEISPGLPWLLSAMVIIGVAMLEELKMRKKYREEYEAYQLITPFLFPIPKSVKQLFLLPLRLFTSYRYPNRRWHVFGLVTFYTVTLLLISLLIVHKPSTHPDAHFSQQQLNKVSVDGLVTAFESATERREKYRRAMDLATLGESAVTPLLHFTKSDDPDKREFALQALAKMRYEEIIEPTVAALRDPNSDVRYTAVTILGELNSKDVVQLLLPCLCDANGLVRCNAAQSLYKLGAYSLDSLLIESLDDEFFYMRITSAEILGKMKSIRAIPSLVDAFSDDDVRVRRTIVLALANFESVEVQDVLISALTDPDWEVRFYASAALRKWKNAIN